METTVAAWLAAGNGDDGAFVEETWLRLLRRPAAADERERALAELRLGVSRSELLHRLVASAEFDGVRLLDDALSWAAAERRKGTRPRGLRAPAGADPVAIAAPWCLARVDGEERVALLGDCPPLEAALRRLAAFVESGPAELVVALDTAGVAERLAPGGRALVAAAQATQPIEGLVVFEEERYADGGEGWHAVPDAGALVCTELRPDRLGTRVRAAFRRT